MNQQFMSAEGGSASGGKNFYIILSIILAVAILTVIIVMGVLTWQKSTHDKLLTEKKDQVTAEESYKPNNDEYYKVKRSEKNDLYYYAADSKRYVFPTIDVYRSWYGDFIIENLKIADLQTLYQTPLGGNVTFRPGTLMKTPSIPSIYLVIKNGLIRPFASEQLVTELYGNDWNKQVYELPEYYFSQYQVGEPIKALNEVPKIPSQININQDKGLE
ncbi:MAG: hypothetical protein NT116_06405 [Candidatus Parcubacteria bacterium]|nr:hypothetical protein [Candidatus Parcubacteria bacterium]